MAAFDTTRPFVSGPAAGTIVTRTFGRVVGQIAAWNDARVTKKSLGKLSDAELADIGMVRGDIDDIAWRRG